MSRRPIQPQSPHHVMIYDEDWRWLAEMYGPKGLQPSISISEAIKTILHQKVVALRARVEQKRDAEG